MQINCITPLKCFCSLLSSIWEFSTSSLRYTVVNFTQITHFLIISSYIEDIETSLTIGKHTLRAFT